MAQRLNTYEVTISRSDDIPFKLAFVAESVEQAIALAHDWLKQQQPTIIMVKRVDDDAQHTV